MEGTSSVGCHDPEKTKTTRGRRSWSQIEEDALIQCLRDIVKDGWKTDNGFKCGFQRELEKGMRKLLAGTDIVANPHINSKIHVWKKEYGTLFDLLSKSGIGWNSTTNTLDIQDESVWEIQKKVDSKISALRHKSWPYYPAWCEIFGKDRATGEGAADIMDFVNDMQNKNVQAPQDDKPQDKTRDKVPTPSDKFATPTDKFATPVDVSEDEAENTSFCKPSMFKAKKSKGKKRKIENNDIGAFIDVCGLFFQSTESTLNGLAQRIGYEQDAKVSRTELYEIMNGIEGLSMQNKLKVSDELVRNTERLEFFVSLPEDAQAEYVRMLLDEKI